MIRPGWIAITDYLESGDQPCVAVTWESVNLDGANCYLKSGIQQVVYGSVQFDSAKLISYNAPPNVSVSVIGSTSTAPTTLPTAASTTTTFSSYQSPSPCPYNNQSQYTDTMGVVYQVDCGEDYLGNDLPSVNVDTFANCMLACSAYLPAPPGDR